MQTIPLPGSHFDGGTVIASVVLNDDEDRPLLWLALLLMRSAPYYRLVEVEGDEVVVRTSRPNIVPAVEDYIQCGGDY